MTPLESKLQSARRMVIIIENDRIGDNPMRNIVIPALRDYADALEKVEAGRGDFEVSERPDGTRVTVMAVGLGVSEYPYGDYVRLG